MNSEEEIQYNSLHEGSYELVSFLDQIIYLVFLLRDTNGFVYENFDAIGRKQNLHENYYETELLHKNQIYAQISSRE